MRDIEITKITTEAKPGATIDDCIERLIFIALAFDCEVVLSHNNHKYITTGQKIKDTVIEKPR